MSFLPLVSVLVGFSWHSPQEFLKNFPAFLGVGMDCLRTYHPLSAVHWPSNPWGFWGRITFLLFAHMVHAALRACFLLTLLRNVLVVFMRKHARCFRMYWLCALGKKLFPTECIDCVQFETCSMLRDVIIGVPCSYFFQALPHLLKQKWWTEIGGLLSVS